MDDLHRELFAQAARRQLVARHRGRGRHHPLGRYYERFADHAVSVAHRVIYLVTGEWHTEAELDGEE